MSKNSLHRAFQIEIFKKTEENLKKFDQIKQQRTKFLTTNIDFIAKTKKITFNTLKTEKNDSNVKKETSRVSSSSSRLTIDIRLAIYIRIIRNICS